MRLKRFCIQHLVEPNTPPTPLSRITHPKYALHWQALGRAQAHHPQDSPRTHQPGGCRCRQEGPCARHQGYDTPELEEMAPTTGLRSKDATRGADQDTSGINGGGWAIGLGWPQGPCQMPVLHVAPMDGTLGSRPSRAEDRRVGAGGNHAT